MTVGKGAEAEIVATLDEHGRIALASKLFGFIIPSALDMEPESNMLAAAVVVDAMAIAAGGRGWLWLPSYVVINMVLSSAQRCTYQIINTYIYICISTFKSNQF